MYNYLGDNVFLIFVIFIIIVFIFIIMFTRSKNSTVSSSVYGSSSDGANSKKLNVLLLDDNLMNLKVNSRILSKFNVSVDCVSTFEECFSKVTSGIKYDLILLDYLIPEHNGADMLNSLKKIDSSLRVVAMHNENNSAQVMSVGFDGYLVKPLKENDVFEIINNIK